MSWWTWLDEQVSNHPQYIFLLFVICFLFVILIIGVITLSRKKWDRAYWVHSFKRFYIRDILKDIKDVSGKAIFWSLVIIIVALAFSYFVSSMSPGEYFEKKLRNNVENWIFGAITFMSTVVSFSAFYRAYNQIFDWDRALVKIQKLIKRGKEVRVFFWTPLLGGVTHREKRSYNDFLNLFRNSIQRFSSEQTDIEIVCLAESSLKTLYDRYKESNSGSYKDAIVDKAWKEVKELMNSMEEKIKEDGTDYIKLERKTSDVLPTFYFILSEKELIVLLPFYMPIHDSYNSQPLPKVGLYGFSTRERYMIYSFEQAFDFYKQLQSKT